MCKSFDNPCLTLSLITFSRKLPIREIRLERLLSELGITQKEVMISLPFIIVVFIITMCDVLFLPVYRPLHIAWL